MVIYCDEYWKDIDRVITRIPNIESLYGKRILITGATGMICSAVVEILFRLNSEKKANIQIYLAGRNKERMEKRFYMANAEYEFVQYDAVKEQKFEGGFNYIIHGASNANPSVYVKEPVETLLANIIGLKSLLDLAAKNNGQRLLYISSSEVYGKKNTADAYMECDYGFLDILNPRASYPSGKRAAETMCVAYSNEYNVDVVIVRPGHIYGPTITDSDNRASAEFSRNAVLHQPIIMKSEGSQLRSYCYTMDCASAILAVLINGEREQAYNISNKESIVSIAGMAKALADACGTEIIFRNPSDREKQGYNLMDNSSLNSRKLEGLGWEACFSIEEGAKKTIRFLKA